MGVPAAARSPAFGVRKDRRRRDGGVGATSRRRAASRLVVLQDVYVLFLFTLNRKDVYFQFYSILDVKTMSKMLKYFTGVSNFSMTNLMLILSSLYLEKKANEGSESRPVIISAMML